MVKVFAVLKPLFHGLMKLAGLRPQILEIEPGTIMNIWVPKQCVLTKTKSHHHQATYVSPDKPAVLLLHSFAADGVFTWLFQVLALAGKYSVYVPDLLFFGGSITDKPERSANFQAEFLAKGMQILGVKKCTVVGLSYGGMIGFRMAKLYPGLVKLLVASATVIELTESISFALYRKLGLSTWSDLLLPDSVDGVKELSSVGSHQLPQLPEFIYRGFLEGSRIHATIKQNQIEKYETVLKETKLYAIKNFIVAENRMRFKTTTAKYKIIFVGSTRLTEISDKSFPWLIYNFKPYEELANVDSVDETFLIDVIGKLNAKSLPQHKEIAGRETKMLDLVLENMQGVTLSCTLWGQLVDDLGDYLAAVTTDEPVIIILQLCRVKVFKGEVRVSNTYHVTKMIINGGIREIKHFRSSLVSGGKSTTPIGKIGMKMAVDVTGEFEMSKDLIRTIEQILEDIDVGSYWVIGKIVAVETGDDWWYISCKKCPKKLTPAADKLYCEKCDSFDMTGNIRYKIQVRVVDSTGNASFLLWDKECNELIGKTALELRNKANDEFPMEIFAMIEKTVLFKIQVKHNQKVAYDSDVFPVIKLIANNSVVDKYRDIYQDGPESDIFSKFKDTDADEEVDLNSSEDEVSTPNIQKNKLKSLHVEEDAAVKRSLIDEFSSTSKGNLSEVVVKIEKD